MKALKTMVPAVLAVLIFSTVALADYGHQWSSWKATNVRGIEYRYDDVSAGMYLEAMEFRNTRGYAVTIKYTIEIPGTDQAAKGSEYVKANDVSGEFDVSVTNGKHPPKRVWVRVVKSPPVGYGN